MFANGRAMRLEIIDEFVRESFDSYEALSAQSDEARIPIRYLNSTPPRVMARVNGCDRACQRLQNALSSRSRVQAVAPGVVIWS